MGQAASSSPSAARAGDDAPAEPSWRAWMGAAGDELWALRARASRAHRAAGLLVTATGMRDAPARTVVVLDARTFEALEAVCGGALEKPAARTANHIRDALTGATGADWSRQRALITRRVLPIGLGHDRPVAIAERAARELVGGLQATLASAPPGAVLQLDLKPLLEPVLARWIVELVVGAPDGECVGAPGGASPRSGAPGGAERDGGARSAAEAGIGASALGAGAPPADDGAAAIPTEPHAARRQATPSAPRGPRASAAEEGAPGSASGWEQGGPPPTRACGDDDDDEPRRALGADFLRFWRSLRARAKHPARTRAAHARLSARLSSWLELELRAAAGGAAAGAEARGAGGGGGAPGSSAHGSGLAHGPAAHAPGGGACAPLLAAMAAHCGTGGTALARSEIVANCVSFLTAGFETTLGVVCVTLLQLGAHQPGRERLRLALGRECAELARCARLRALHCDALRALKASATTGAPLPAAIARPVPPAHPALRAGPGAPAAAACSAASEADTGAAQAEASRCRASGAAAERAPASARAGAADAPATPDPASARAGAADATTDPAMLLVRCMGATLWACPPVLTLPRVVRTDELRARCPALARGAPAGKPGERTLVRADTLCCGGAAAEDACARWDPLRAPPGPRLAAFGLGRRACPAGTAALLAAWTILRHVLAAFELVELVEVAGSGLGGGGMGGGGGGGGGGAAAAAARQPGLPWCARSALGRAYLAPTLCVDGPMAMCAAARAADEC